MLIRRGRIMDPASGADETADLVVDKGRIEEIAPAGRAPAEGREEVDARGCGSFRGSKTMHAP
jgi:dihydroorotase